MQKIKIEIETTIDIVKKSTPISLPQKNIDKNKEDKHESK